MRTKENRWLRGKKWSKKVIKILDKQKAEPYELNKIKILTK